MLNSFCLFCFLFLDFWVFVCFLRWDSCISGCLQTPYEAKHDLDLVLLSRSADAKTAGVHHDHFYAVLEMDDASQSFLQSPGNQLGLISSHNHQDIFLLLHLAVF